MPVILSLFRFIVGVLFIFSGLIKANDPLGLSYKMQEFFEVWGLHGLDNITLAFAIIMITFEIIAGVAVLIGWKFRLFSWLLLLLILFFTFLTGYAVLSGKIRECGCFGDCIKLTAMDSFVKDLALLLLILFIFFFRNRVKPLFSGNVNLGIMLLTLAATLALQWYALTYLPPVDCLPYKKGNNVIEKMKIPQGAVPDSSVITFVYKKNGQEVEFTADKFPADFDDSYSFVKRYDKLVRKGNAEAPIKDFSLTNSNGVNVTDSFLLAPGRKLLVFVRNVPADIAEYDHKFTEAQKEAAAANISFAVVTSRIEETRIVFDKFFSSPISYYTCDAVAVKTASRSPVTYYIFNGPVVEKKWSYENDVNIKNMLR